MEENKRQLITETVSKKLTEAQKAKEFKDTGIVSYTKKYSRLWNIVTVNTLDELELDQVNAYKQVEKSKVWLEYNLQEQKDKGYSSGATYLKVKCREALQTRPFDSRDARDVYVKNITKVIEILDSCFTAKEVRDKLWEFINAKDFYYGKDEKVNQFGYYSSNMTKKLETILGKRFINFCKFNSDAAHKDYDAAVLYDKFTKEQQDEYIIKQLEYSTSRLEALNKNLQEATIKANDDEMLYNEIRVRFSGYVKVLKTDFDSKKEEYREMYLSGFKNAINREINYQKDLTERTNLKPQYVIRDDNWDWAFGEKEKTEHKKSTAPKINTKIPLDHIVRTGGFKIPDVSVESITKYFCFNNVVFGNALKDIESREHIRHFLGALSDLAELLEINICAVNQLGKLDINFATMGVSGHMATYFPSVKAINLTKKKGDGSVAHEWFHYFDNVIQEGAMRRGTPVLASEACSIGDIGTKQAIYLLSQFILRGDQNEPEYITQRFMAQGKIAYRLFGDTAEKCVSEIQRMYPKYATSSAMKDKTVANYYGYIAHKFEKEYIDVSLKLSTSKYYYNSSRIGTSYWIENAELFARAFEAYIEFLLELKDRKNNYLVSYKNNWVYYGSSMPYPQGKELEKIVILFDNIFKEFKKEFSIGDYTPFTTERENEYTEIIDKPQITEDMKKMIREPQPEIKEEVIETPAEIIETQVEQQPEIIPQAEEGESFESIVLRNETDLKNAIDRYLKAKDNTSLKLLEAMQFNYMQEVVKVDNSKIEAFYNLMLPVKNKLINMALFYEDESFFRNLNKNLWHYIPDAYKTIGKIKKVAHILKHDNDGLKKITSSFVAKDDLRPIMNSVHFNEEGVLATDAHKMIFIAGKPEVTGEYCLHTNCFKSCNNDKNCKIEGENKIIAQPYPNWKSVIPDLYNHKIFSINVDSLRIYAETILDAELTQQVSEFSLYKIDENEFIAFKASFLLDCLKAMQMLGHNELDICLSDATHAAIIIPKGNKNLMSRYETDFALLMPMMSDDHTFRKGELYFDLSNESVGCIGIENDEIELNPMVVREKELDKTISETKALKEKLETESKVMRSSAKLWKALRNAEFSGWDKYDKSDWDLKDVPYFMIGKTIAKDEYYVDLRILSDVDTNEYYYEVHVIIEHDKALIDNHKLFLGNLLERKIINMEQYDKLLADHQHIESTFDIDQEQDAVIKFMEYHKLMDDIINKLVNISELKSHKEKSKQRVKSLKAEIESQTASETQALLQTYRDVIETYQELLKEAKKKAEKQTYQDVIDTYTELVSEIGVNKNENKGDIQSLIGAVISKARYLVKSEADAMMWDKSGLVIIAKDNKGNQFNIYTQSDAEGNNAGAIFSNSEMFEFPAIDFRLADHFDKWNKKANKLVGKKIESISHTEIKLQGNVLLQAMSDDEGNDKGFFAIDLPENFSDGGNIKSNISKPYYHKDKSDNFTMEGYRIDNKFTSDIYAFFPVYEGIATDQEAKEKANRFYDYVKGAKTLSEYEILSDQFISGKFESGGNVKSCGCAFAEGGQIDDMLVAIHDDVWPEHPIPATKRSDKIKAAKEYVDAMYNGDTEKAFNDTVLKDNDYKLSSGGSISDEETKIAQIGSKVYPDNSPKDQIRLTHSFINQYYNGNINAAYKDLVLKPERKAIPELQIDEYADGGEIFTCPDGLTAQSIIFNNEKWTVNKARKWLKDHKYNHMAQYTATENFYRFRQMSPRNFKAGSYKTIRFGDSGILGIFGCKKSKKK